MDWFHWEQAQNRCFQRRCVAWMKGIPDDGRRRTVFAFSYAALDILKEAKRRGWRTVLGQIDPGPRESEIVLQEYKRLGVEPGEVYRPPLDYWHDWEEETRLADHIAVNSTWSARCLADVGVDPQKMKVIPCAYEPHSSQLVHKKNFPHRFCNDRPLRVLFLGQTIIRKGIHLLMAAAEKMRHMPVHFVVAGGGLDFPGLAIPGNVTWKGSVSRLETKTLYGEADVFILPTLSDGFAITQLEALAMKVPVIASGHCGSVVDHGQNGIILAKVSVEAICSALRELLASPVLLKGMSDRAQIAKRFSIDQLGEELEDLR